MDTFFLYPLEERIPTVNAEVHELEGSTTSGSVGYHPSGFQWTIPSMLPKAKRDHYATRSVAYYPRYGQNHLPSLPDRPFAPPGFPIPYWRSFHAFPAKTSSMTHGGKTGYNGVPRMEKSW